MDRLLKPRVFETDHNATDAAKQWKYFFKTFQNFLSAVDASANKLQLLINYVSPDVYTLIEDCESYELAIATLKKIYVKPPNTVYARHLLSTRRQQQGESLDSFLQALKDLSRDCSFGAVTADQHRDEYIRDSFITGIASNTIRQRLLENSELDLQTMFAQARSLDIAQKSSESYQSQLFKVNAAQKADDVHQSNKSDTYESRDVSNQRRDSQLAAASNKCPYCGYNMHPPQKCPARNESCRN